MRRLSAILLILSTLTLPFACSEPETPSGNGNKPGGGEPDAPTTYSVGDYYKSGLAEGIVAYIDESGEHGLLISIDETITQWSTEHEMLTVMGGEFSMEDGASNSAYIRQQEDWESRFPAFAWCHAKNVLGLTAWFLPSINEFDLVYAGLEAINTTLTEMGKTPISTGVNDSYWTSVEVGVQSAYAYSFYEGDISSYNLDKLNEHYVRAMRTF